MTSGLFINGRFLTQQTTGVQSFARSICTELARVTDFKILVPSNALLINDEFSSLILRTGSFQGHLWEQLDLPRFMKKHPGATLLNLCNTGPAFFNNQVSTIHDLAFIKNPSWFQPLFARYYSWLVPKVAKNSSAVLTVSESIKKELQAVYGIGKSKIFVAGNKISPSLLSAKPLVPSSSKIQSKTFFLMVGSADPRKNFAMAEKLFAEKLYGSTLVIAGGSHRSFRENSNNLHSENIVHLGYTDEATLRWLYENALAFINPSLYEGFGIPNLEAFAFGCPVICSNIPVFREVCGEAAYYFDPAVPDTLQEAIRLCLSFQHVAEEKTSRGKIIFTAFQNLNRSQIVLNALAL